MSESDSDRIYVIIPAFNEENSVGKVVEDLPKSEIEEVVVVNNNSNDKTSENAFRAGATVLDERKPGYGRACLKGIEYVSKKAADNDIIVFLDADYSDYPEQLIDVIKPIREEKMDLVIGSREKGKREKGSMTVPQIFGNRLATKLIYLIYRERFTDLGPFRAIRFRALQSLEMRDKTYGWTVEMQVKAIKKNLNFCEVAVDYRKRIGFSKVSGTIKGTILAGYKIIATIIRYL